MHTFKLRPGTDAQIKAQLRAEGLRLLAPKVCRQWWLTEKWVRIESGPSRGDYRRARIRICDMDNAHLLNAIWRLRKDHDDDARIYGTPGYYSGYENGGRENLIPQTHPLFDALVMEARRRGLPLKRKPKWLEKQNAKWGEMRRARDAANRSVAAVCFDPSEEEGE